METNSSTAKLSISESFEEEEVALLDQLFVLLLRGGSPEVLRRQPAFGSICRKVVGMKQRVKEAKGLSSTEVDESE
jgi:hypothetical protein